MFMKILWHGKNFGFLSEKTERYKSIHIWYDYNDIQRIKKQSYKLGDNRRDVHSQYHATTTSIYF